MIAFRVAAVLVLFGTNTLSAQDRSVNEILDAFAKSYSIMEHIEFDFESQFYQRGGSFPVETLVISSESKCSRDGHSWRIERSAISNFRKDVNKPPGTLKTQYVVFGDSMKSVLFNGDQYGARARLTDAVTKSPPGWQNLSGSGFLFGFTLGNENKFLPDFLRENPPQVEAQELDGRSTHCLISRGPFGVYQVWVVPASNFQLCRMRILKDSSNTLGNIKVGEAETGGKMPKGKLSSP